MGFIRKDNNGSGGEGESVTIVDNLNSSSTTSALSANQGKILNEKIEAIDVPTKTSELENDSNFISSIPSEYVTETKLNKKGYLTEIPSEYVTESELNAKGYLTEHIDISGKANKSDIPTKTSQLTNDSGYLTSIPSEYVTDDELNNALAVLIARIEELEERLNSGVE